MKWSDLLHLTYKEMTSLIDGKVIDLDVYQWAMQHLPECQYCRERYNFLLDILLNTEESEDEEIEETEEQKAQREEIKAILKNFLAEEQAKKVIPFRRKEEDEKK